MNDKYINFDEYIRQGVIGATARLYITRLFGPCFATGTPPSRRIFLYSA